MEKEIVDGRQELKVGDQLIRQPVREKQLKILTFGGEGDIPPFQPAAQRVRLVSNRLVGPEESDEVWKERAWKILDAIPNCVFGIYECPYPYKRLMSPELLKWCASTGPLCLYQGHLL